MTSQNSKFINTLDISNSGNLNSYYARFLNQTADEIQNDYINCINELVSQQKDKFHLLLTPCMGRNTYLCNVYEEISKILLVKSIYDSNILIKEVIVETPIMKRIVRSFLPDSIKIKSNQNNFQYYFEINRSILAGYVKYILSSVFRLASYRLVSLFSSSKSYVNHNESFTVIETYLYRNSFSGSEFYDRHFCNLDKYISEKKSSRILYIPVFYKTYNYFSAFRKAFKSKKNFLFIEEFLSLFDLFSALLHPFKLNFNHSNILIRGVDVSKLINHSLLRHSSNTSSMYAILKYRFSKNLRKKNVINISRVIRWYENQEVDRGSIMGWRLFSKSLKIIGYMGYFAPQNYLCTFPIKIEHELNLVPDTLGVMGKGLIGQHNRHCDKLNIEIAPSFRFTLPKNNSSYSRITDDELNILVTFPIETRHIQVLVHLIKGILSKQHEICLRFILKPHPVSKFSSRKYFSDLDNEKIFFTEEPVELAFKDVDMVLSFSSSTLVEAIMHDKFAVLVSPVNQLRQNVIPSIVPHDFWHEVYSVEELNAIISNRSYLRFSNKDLLLKTNARLVGEEPNHKNVSLFLGI